MLKTIPFVINSSVKLSLVLEQKWWFVYAACERVVQCSLTLYLALCCLLHKNDKLVGKWGGWNIYMLYESSVSLATIELFFLPTRVPPLLPKSDGLLPHHWCRCCLHHRHAHPDGALSQPYQAHWRWHALLGGLVGLRVDIWFSRDERLAMLTCFTGLTGLRQLSLDNTLITDKGISHIAG